MTAPVFAGVLIFFRLSVLFTFLPVLGDRLLSDFIKIIIYFTLTFFAIFYLNQVYPELLQGIFFLTLESFLMACIKEILLAILIGSTIRWVFDGWLIGGQLIGHFMGFSFATLFDPHQESHVDIMAKFQSLIVIFLFLSLNAHLKLMEMCLKSFEYLPLGEMSLKNGIFQEILRIASEAILLGIQFSLPIGATIFCVHIAFGLLGKALPQLNIFSISSSTTALVGFFVLFSMQADILVFIHENIESFLEKTYSFLRYLQGDYGRI